VTGSVVVDALFRSRRFFGLLLWKSIASVGRVGRKAKTRPVFDTVVGSETCADMLGWFLFLA